MVENISGGLLRWQDEGLPVHTLTARNGASAILGLGPSAKPND